MGAPRGAIVVGITSSHVSRAQHLFLIYSTWAAFQGNNYRFGPYLSPFYSRRVLGNPQHALAWRLAVTGGLPGLPISAALLILWAPGGFRLTCYYYRGAYYKAFWADPPSCTVGEPRKHYRGERSFPLILQNGHRYFLYLALLFLMLLALDVWRALWFMGYCPGSPVWYRRGNTRACGERRSAQMLHIRLSFASPSGRRPLDEIRNLRPEEYL